MKVVFHYVQKCKITNSLNSIHKGKEMDNKTVLSDLKRGKKKEHPLTVHTNKFYILITVDISWD